MQPNKYLGEILFRIGVPQQKINQALYYFHKRKTIDEILVDQQLVSFEKLEEALRQRTINLKLAQARRLGLLLIEMGYIDVYGYLTALSKHFNMPILSLKNFEPSCHLQNKISIRYAIERRIIVLEDNSETQTCSCRAVDRDRGGTSEGHPTRQEN